MRPSIADQLNPTGCAISASEIVPRGDNSWGSVAFLDGPTACFRADFLGQGSGSSPPFRTNYVRALAQPLPERAYALGRLSVGVRSVERLDSIARADSVQPVSWARTWIGRSAMSARNVRSGCATPTTRRCSNCAPPGRDIRAARGAPQGVLALAATRKVEGTLDALSPISSLSPSHARASDIRDSRRARALSRGGAADPDRPPLVRPVERAPLAVP